MDTVFRTKSEPVKPEVMPKGKEPNRSGDESPSVDVPYSDYEATHNHPYIVDYFELGKNWDDPTGGFPEEVSLIEKYISGKVKSGELPNNVNSIKEKLKEMEKANKMSKEPRAVVKVATIAAYVKFLMETDNINLNLSRYGN